MTIERLESELVKKIKQSPANFRFHKKEKTAWQKFWSTGEDKYSFYSRDGKIDGWVSHINQDMRGVISNFGEVTIDGQTIRLSNPSSLFSAAEQFCSPSNQEVSSRAVEYFTKN